MAAFEAFLDPHEELDWIIPCEGYLEPGEAISTYTLSFTAEAAALGLTLMTGSGRDHGKVEADKSIKLWIDVSGAYEDNAAFEGGGTELPLQLNFTTNSTPARTRDLTAYLLVKQRILQ